MHLGMGHRNQLSFIINSSCPNDYSLDICENLNFKRIEQWILLSSSMDLIHPPQTVTLCHEVPSTVNGLQIKNNVEQCESSYFDIA